MLRLIARSARQTQARNRPGLRSTNPRAGQRCPGLKAQLDRERRARQIRRFRRVQLTRREKWLAAGLVLLILLACAAGGWLGMHLHPHEVALRRFGYPWIAMLCKLEG